MTHIPKTRFVACTAMAFAAVACSKSNDAKIDTTTPAPAASTAATSSPTPSPDSMVLVRGTVASMTSTQVVVKTDSASVTVAVTPPLQLYSRGTGDLAHVTPNTFIGVTTVKQADGAEKATEIHIFPEALRGLGEGSRMMNPPSNGSAASRMTNGSVSTAASDSSGSRMTNGAVAGSASGAARMSNGEVSNKNGSTMVVQYAGGSTTVTVPPKTPVTEIKAASRSLKVGDAVVLVATKGSDGALTSNKALLAK